MFLYRKETRCIDYFVNDSLTCPQVFLFNWID